MTQQDGDDTDDSARDLRGRRAVVWSFFVPPMGVILGLLALRSRDSRARHEAWVALLNGAFGTAILVAAILLLPPFFRWYRDYLLGGF